MARLIERQRANILIALSFSACSGSACSGRADAIPVDAAAQSDANHGDAASVPDGSRLDAFFGLDVLASDAVARDAPNDRTIDTQQIDARSSSDTRSAPDSAAEPADAFATPPNDECSGAVDISAGGTFAGTTCGATDTASTRDCAENSSGADIFFVLRNLPPRSMGYSYTLEVSSGFMIADAIDRGSSTCSISRIECLAGQTQSLGVSVAGGGTYFYAIQRSESGCGAFSLSVTPR